MELYKNFEIENNCEYKYDYNFGNNNLENIEIQNIQNKKFDILLDGILYNDIKI